MSTRCRLLVRGVIARLLPDQAVGFVRRADGDVAFRFDRRVLVGETFDDLRPGQFVRFEEGDGRHGPRARRIVVD